MITVTRLPTTFDNRSVNACCAPRTSLFSRLMRAPVWVRVKKARGMLWMWRNTFERMSKIKPSPMTAEIRRSVRERHGVDEGQPTGEERQADDQVGIVVADAVVDQGPQDQRVDRAETASRTTTGRNMARIFL